MMKRRILPARLRVAPLFVGAVCVALGAAPSEAAAKVNYGPISHKGLHKVGAASTSLKLRPPARPGREQLGPAEGGEVGEQPVVVVVRQVPVAVEAAEQVRRVVVEAQGRRERVQVEERQGHGRRDPPARERDGVASARRRRCSGRSGPTTRRPRVDVSRCRSTRRSCRRGSRATSTRSPGMRYSVKPRAASSGVGAGGGLRRRHADADRHRGAVVPRHDRPRRGRVGQRPVPEPDPDRVRDRAAAGRRPAGPGRRGWRSSARRRRRPRT